MLCNFTQFQDFFQFISALFNLELMDNRTARNKSTALFCMFSQKSACAMFDHALMIVTTKEETEQ